MIQVKRPAKISTFEVQEDDNTDSNYISGIAVTEKGFLLITDSDQNSVKCISPDSKCVSVLGLESSPNEVTMIGETKAAVATENGVDILKIEKSGSLSIEKKLKMDHEVWGIAETYWLPAMACIRIRSLLIYMGKSCGL